MDLTIYIEKKMRNFIKATNIDMWDIVELGYEVLKIMINENFQPKVKSLWIEKERRKNLIVSKVKMDYYKFTFSK